MKLKKLNHTQKMVNNTDFLNDDKIIIMSNCSHDKSNNTVTLLHPSLVMMIAPHLILPISTAQHMLHKPQHFNFLSTMPSLTP